MHELQSRNADVPTCLSLMAAESPAGPAPTMQTSYSIASLGSRLSADMLRAPISACMTDAQR